MSTPQKREGLPPPPLPSDADDVSELALSSLFLKSLFLLALALEELSLLPNFLKLHQIFGSLPL